MEPQPIPSVCKNPIFYKDTGETLKYCHFIKIEKYWKNITSSFINLIEIIYQGLGRRIKAQLYKLLKEVKSHIWPNICQLETKTSWINKNNNYHGGELMANPDNIKMTTTYMNTAKDLMNRTLSNKHSRFIIILLKNLP